MRGFANLRKAHCMFGWDWGPHLPDAGIWRPVYLLGVNGAKLDSVHIRQHHQHGRVKLTLEPELSYIDVKEINYTVRLTDPQGHTTRYEGSPKEILIEHPELWWPHGYGEQPLYTVKVTAFSDGRELDTWQRRIGLRTMTMHMEKDQYGESFAHEVNGVQIFAMGADYIPEDNILSRVTPERTRNLLEQCVAANFNCIRVWGGGYYPDDAFYDACDELGLMVWQDFMFACAVYNLTPEFAENIRAEVIDNVRRLRHHAIFGPVVRQQRDGNVRGPGRMGAHAQAESGLYPHVRVPDPRGASQATIRTPSTGRPVPLAAAGLTNPMTPPGATFTTGTCGTGQLPFAEYRKHQFRYLSEFGFESLPCMKTVEDLHRAGGLGTCSPM